METVAAGGGDGEGDSIWSAAANWIPAAGGSLCEVIAFETSEIDNEEEARPLFLLRPEGDDPPPCEITINFKKKHEIHSVYVRSTSRVYEIYYSPDHQDGSKEYLCTVRCGAAVREEVSERDTSEADYECQGKENVTGAKPDRGFKSGSSNSDEDGWVQIRAPNLNLLDKKDFSMSKSCEAGMDSSITQICYEATAEISDSIPCASLTLRLLSIQTKVYAYVEEIYIYADPVESSASDPPATVGEISGSSSLLAMLVPSLTQLSRLKASQDQCLSKKAPLSNHEYNTDITAQSAQTDQKMEAYQEQTKMETEDAQSESTKEVTAPNHMPNSLSDQINIQSCSRLEKVLDELVLKVGKVEAFCTKFEEKMLKPLSSVEQRLQQLEQKLDALAAQSKSSEQCLCSRICSSSHDNNDLKSKGGTTEHIELGEDIGFIVTSSPAGEEELPSVIEYQTHAGLVIKAPDFLNEYDDCFYSEDVLDPSAEDLPAPKKPLSIDNALASSLAAFLTSTTVKRSTPVPRPAAVPQESADCNGSALDSSIRVPSDGAGNLSSGYAIEDNVCDLEETVKGSCFSYSLLPSLEAASPNHKESFSRKNNSFDSCDNSDAVIVDSTLDDSVVSNLPSPGSLAQSSVAVIDTSSEFLNRYVSDDTINTYEPDCHGHETSMSTENETVFSVAESPYLTTLQSPKTTSAMLTASSRLSSADSNELTTSTVALLTEAANGSGSDKKEENKMNDEVFSDPTLSTMPLEASFGQEHNNDVACKEWQSVEQIDEPLAQDSDDHTLLDHDCHSKSSDCVDSREEAPHGFNQHDRGWVEDDCSTSPSFHGDLITHFESRLSAGNGIDSPTEAGQLTFLSNWQSATSDNGSDVAFDFEKAFTSENPTVTCESSPGRLAGELEDICNVRFTSDINLTGVLPLELLLGKMPDDKHVCSTSGGGGDDAARAQHLQSSSASEGIHLETDDSGVSLLEVQPHPPSDELNLLENDLQCAS